MANTLLERYVSRWSGPSTLGSELVHEAPQRQLLMIDLARRQVDEQRSAARAVVASNLAGAQIMARELDRQTDTLVTAIDRLAEGVTSAIASGAEGIMTAIDSLGDRLCASIDEVRWQLAQCNESLEGILDTLRESRSNKARQLVHQGLRHYLNGEYAEAEARLKLALDCDTTDYQVLLNLAFLAVHTGDAVAAFTLFQKALSLPAKLDAAARRRVLWAMARLHYAEGDHNRAHQVAVQALGLAIPPSGIDLFITGVYAGLAGDGVALRDKLSDAIRVDPELFTRAAIDPDLDAVRAEVLELLSAISVKAHASASAAQAELHIRLATLAAAAPTDEDLEVLARVTARVRAADALLAGGSYSECLEVTSSAQTLSAIIGDEREIVATYRGKAPVDANLADALKRDAAVQSLRSWFCPGEEFWVAWPLLSYLSIGAVGYLFAWPTAPPGTVFSWGNLILGASLWPLFFVAMLVSGQLLKRPDSIAFLNGLLLTLAVSMAFLAARWRMGQLAAGTGSDIAAARAAVSGVEQGIEEFRRRLETYLSHCGPVKESRGRRASPRAAAESDIATSARSTDQGQRLTIILKDAGALKVPVIRVIREVTSLGLKEAKELVDGAPATVWVAESRAEADGIKRRLEEQGAVVDVE